MLKLRNNKITICLCSCRIFTSFTVGRKPDQLQVAGYLASDINDCLCFNMHMISLCTGYRAVALHEMTVLLSTH